jgi:hypothetical protein
MSDRELNLDGGEIALIKAIGLSGTEVTGEDLLKRCPDQTAAELIDTLKGLMMQGFVECDGGSMHDVEAFKRYNFSVNSGYAKDLRESLNPQRSQPRSKRVRRE